MKLKLVFNDPSTLSEDVKDPDLLLMQIFRPSVFIEPETRRPYVPVEPDTSDSSSNQAMIVNVPIKK